MSNQGRVCSVAHRLASAMAQSYSNRWTAAAGLHTSCLAPQRLLAAPTPHVQHAALTPGLGAGTGCLAPHPSLLGNHTSLWPRPFASHRIQLGSSTRGLARRVSAANTISPEASLNDGDEGVPRDAQEYWAEVLSKIDPTSHLGALARAMNPRLFVGMTHEWAKKRGKSAVPCFEEYVRFKKTVMDGQHVLAKHVVLVQIGDFYETIGIDALVLAKWLGYRITNEAAGVPRAGFPLFQRQSVVNRLLKSGFSVAVVKQHDSPSSGSRLTRYLHKTYSPIYGGYDGGEIGDEGDAGDDDVFNLVRPVMGVAWTKSGYVLHTLLLESRKVEVQPNLTEAAVMSQLAARGAVGLMLHSSLDDGKKRAFKTALARFARNEVGLYESYDDKDFTAGFVNRVSTQVMLQGGLSSDTHHKRNKLEVVYTSERQDDRPQPLARSTVSQLGIEGDNAIPNLLDFLLPRNAPVPCKDWMRQHVMLPPPPAMALHIRAALDFLTGLQQGLPAVNTDLPAGKVVEAIDSLSGDAKFFRQLHGLLTPLVTELDQPSFEPLWEHVVAYAMWMDRWGDTITTAQLQSNLKQTVDAIEHIIQLSTVSHVLRDASGEENKAQRDVRGLSAGYQRQEKALVEDAHRTSRDELEKLFQECEKFRRDVKPQNLQEQLKEVHAKRAALDQVIMYTWTKFTEQCGTGTRSAPLVKAVGEVPVIIYKPNIIPFARIQEALQKLNPSCHVMPIDMGKSVPNAYTSTQIKAAVEEYHNACKQAEEQVRQVLRQLCERLALLLPSLLLACRFSVIKTALEEHATMSIQQQWSAPRLAPLGPTSRTQPAGNSTSPTAGHHPDGMNMHLTGFWPYWLQVNDKLRTITNDITLDRFILLTGPNMAGKSTVLRSVCAVALAANCGLNVPAAEAVVPWYDSFLLRNFSGDSPLEGKSSFALEMEEVSSIDKTSTSKSLILLDELGKGTEVDKGTAIVYAQLEEWCKGSFTGICATHLLMMESIAMSEGLGKDGKLGFKQVGVGKHNKRLLDGVCYDSQAEVIAEQAGVAPEILDRAHQIWCRIISGQHNPYVRPAERSWLGIPVHLTPGDITRAPTPMPISEPRPISTASASPSSSDSSSSEPDEEQGPSDEGGVSEATGESGYTLEQAGDVLMEVLRSQQTLQQGQQLIRLRPGTQPPPSMSVGEVVYVFLGPLGRFYCGQTGSISERLKEHRRSKAKDKGKEIDLMFVPVQRGTAEQVEALVIEELRSQGFPMSSTRSTKRKRGVLAASRDEVYT